MPKFVEIVPGLRPGDPPRSPRAPRLPSYEPQLSSFHRAFAGELGSIVECLPLRRGMRVLDLACGDGFYARRMAERLGPGSLVVGADANLAYLHDCKASGAGGPDQARSGFVGSQFDRLPFPDGTFDLVWCAQSLYSLPDAVAAVASMARVLRPGGQVAVLENDALHHVILPWPIALELPLRAAELRAYQVEGRAQQGFEVGRRLPAILAAAGLEPLRLTTHAFDRQAPLAPPERELLRCYLEALLRRVAPHVAPALLGELQRLVDPGSATCLLRQPDLSMTWLCVLATGRKGLPRRAWSSALGLEACGRPALAAPDRSRPA
jgi:SAM-dependent methyltransferase